MSNDKCQYCGRPLAGEICPAHGYVGNPIPVTPFDPATSGVPTGAEMMWPVATPPFGWLIEDGSSQLITDHPALSALIRSTYGGADGTHFNLPATANLIPAMTSDTAPSGVAFASTFDPNFAAWKAFNHTNAASIDGWIAATGTTGGVGYKFPSAHVIASYAVTSRNNGALSRVPKTWTFQGSNDGSTWDVLGTQTNITDWAATGNVRKVFNLVNTASYDRYYLYITASNDASYVGVGELEMMQVRQFVIKT